jgi:hypothetical protein
LASSQLALRTHHTNDFHRSFVLTQKDIRLSKTIGSLELLVVVVLEHPTPACFELAAHDGRFVMFISAASAVRVHMHHAASNHGNLVELIGIEPTTSGLQSPRSPS